MSILEAIGNNRTRFLRFTVCAILVGLLFTACSPQRKDPVIPPSTIPISTPLQTQLSPNEPVDLGEVIEAERLLSMYGNQVWPGWGDSIPPVLIQQSEYDYLLGHPQPPDGFELVPGAALGGQPIYRKRGHLVPVPAATTWNVGGIWSVAIPVRAEFQRAVDAQLGVGVVNLTPASYIRALVHEAFHAYQNKMTWGNLPVFGMSIDEQKAIGGLLGDPSLDEKQRQEGLALRAGLTATTSEAASQAAEQYLNKFRSHQEGRSADLTSYEQSTEWIEGLARYADISLMRLAGNPVKADGSDPVGYPAPEAAWQELLDGLSNPAATQEGFRGRYYILGAGQAFLLDKLQPDWKQSAFSNPQPLDALFEQALMLP